jgi:hypothetical protein
LTVETDPGAQIEGHHLYMGLHRFKQL